MWWGDKRRLIRDIEGKVDKILIMEKEFQKISKWNRERECGFDSKMFFPLKTFVLDIREKFKCLVELNDFNPVKGGRITTDKFWYTWDRQFRYGKGGFQFDGFATKDQVEICHALVMGCLMYICLAEREKEYRIAVENAKKNGCEPYKYTDRVCFLLKDIIQYVRTHQTRKSVKISCECWGVRGHIRHYENGKAVFIEPYKKGKKRDILEPKTKTYLLGGKNDKREGD